MRKIFACVGLCIAVGMSMTACSNTSAKPEAVTAKPAPCARPVKPLASNPNKPSLSVTPVPKASQEQALNDLQGDWGLQAAGPALFRIQGQNAVWLGSQKSYPLVMKGNILTGNLTDDDGITCYLEMTGGPVELQLKRKNCVDQNNKPTALTNLTALFIKVLPAKP